MSARKPSTLWILRATWALTLLFPLPAYWLELSLLPQVYGPGGENPLRVVEFFGVQPTLAAFTALVLGAAIVVPRIAHRRAMARLRRLARLEVDPLRDGAYRVPPPRALRFPSDAHALAAAEARYASRSAATLAMVALVELVLFVALSPIRSTCCFGGCSGASIFFPEPSEHLLLVGLVAVVMAFELPTRGAIARPIRDLLP